MPKSTNNWNLFLNGKIPFIVIKGVLYRTDRGQVYKAWMDNQTCECFTDSKCERVGVVPKQYSDKLKDTATELTKIGMIPLPMPAHEQLRYVNKRRKGILRNGRNRP